MNKFSSSAKTLVKLLRTLSQPHVTALADAKALADVKAPDPVASRDHVVEALDLCRKMLKGENQFRKGRIQ